MVEQVHAVIHCGTHGTLEWLPGKAVALSETCAPRAVLGPVPLIYPFIVNNPGEAAQAKRRVAAVTIGHLTPPLTAAGTHGPPAELEGSVRRICRGAIARSAPRRPAGRTDHGACTARPASPRSPAFAPDEDPRRGVAQTRCLAVRHQGHADRRRVARLRPGARRGPAGRDRFARRHDRRGEDVGPAPGRHLRRGGNARTAGSPGRPLRPARSGGSTRSAAVSTCCRPAAISTASIRARCRRGPPGRSAAAPPRRC